MYKTVHVFMIHCSCGGALDNLLHVVPIFMTKESAERFLTITGMAPDPGHTTVITEVSLMVPKELLV